MEGESWPTPSDYDVLVRLDEPRRALTGSATVRYRNNSRDALPYLWLLLDQN
jgi:hypothetical protein